MAAVCRRTRLARPQAQREFLARIDTYPDQGPPPAEQRMSREEIRTQFGV